MLMVCVVGIEVSLGPRSKARKQEGKWRNWENHAHGNPNISKSYCDPDAEKNPGMEIRVPCTAVKFDMAVPASFCAKHW